MKRCTIMLFGMTCARPRMTTGHVNHFKVCCNLQLVRQTVERPCMPAMDRCHVHRSCTVLEHLALGTDEVTVLYQCSCLLTLGSWAMCSCACEELYFGAAETSWTQLKGLADRLNCWRLSALLQTCCGTACTPLDTMLRCLSSLHCN